MPHLLQDLNRQAASALSCEVTNCVGPPRSGSLQQSATTSSAREQLLDQPQRRLLPEPVGDLLNRCPCPIRKCVECLGLDYMGLVVDTIQIANPKLGTDERNA